MATRLQRLRREEVFETFPFAGPAFRRAAPWLLAAVTFLALAARVHPALRHAVWGSDSGEYQFLTAQLVDTGRILFDYDGWGLAYPYFPGMFVVNGAVHSVMGVDLFLAVQWSVPVLAASIPVLVGLITYRVTSDPRAGVLAAAFIAVTAPVVLVTSHAMPGTLGHILLLALLAFLPDSYRDIKHLPALAILALALVLTHHLTTYFAVGILAMIPFYREMTQRWSNLERLRIEIVLGALLLGAALVWWLGVAAPFRERIVGDALDANPWLTAGGFLLALAALPAAVLLKRRQTNWHLNPRYPGFPRQRAYALSTFLGFVAVVLFAILVGVPGTNMKVDWLALAYVVPVLAFVAFLPLGFSTIRFYRHGGLVMGWLLAILGSLAFAVATNSKVLFPFRHIDYMLEAMAPMIAVGLLMVYDQALASRVPSERPRMRTNLVTGIVVLILLGAAFSLPPRETIGGFEEGISRNELNAVYWARDNPQIIPEQSTIAADHRVSSLLWGLAGLHATWDYTPQTYHSENVSGVFDELEYLDIPAGKNQRIDYVFLSPEIIEGVTLLQWENSRPMSQAAVEKFDDTHYFEPVYDRDGVKIFRIKWENVGISTP